MTLLEEIIYILMIDSGKNVVITSDNVKMLSFFLLLPFKIVQ